MTIDATLARIDAIRQAIADPAQLVGSSVGATGGVQAPASGEGAPPPQAFAAALARASDGLAAGAGTSEGPPGVGVSYPYGYQPLGLAGSVAPAGMQGAGGPGARIVAAAESQIGQAEQPPGSNESPAIAQYRASTAGAVAGAPWCAYFASWAAGQAGEPIGPGGQGLGSVSEIWSWAQSTGRAVANGPGVTPRAGDLIVFGSEHVGIVRDVLPDGRIQTIEGNYEDKVSANVRSATEATGYVSMG